MKKLSVLLITLLAFTSCKKHDVKSILGVGDDETRLKSSIAHPLSYCNDGIPIGGGAGYNSIIGSKQADIVISAPMTAASFKSLIESSANKIIYINPNVVIDLTGLTTAVLLPPNITIASNRGVGTSLGAMIRTYDFCEDGTTCAFDKEVFRSAGNNIRVTGIRLRGPSFTPGGSQVKMRTGILMKGYDGLEVDNCELLAWPYSPVEIGLVDDPAGASNNNNRIHHNFIHLNNQDGYGYGVAVNNGFALVKANEFEGNRHDIACSGSRNTNNTGYEASCNIVYAGGTSQNFDVHGEDQDSKSNASTFFYIHHNYFMDLGLSNGEADKRQNIIIRGRPDHQCRIENNIFKHDGPANAILQTSAFETGFGNLLVFNNVYKYGLNEAPGAYLGFYLKPDWNKKDVNNFMNIPSTNTQLMSSIGLVGIIDYEFGDYDGDGKTDIYKISNGALYVMPYQITNGLTQDWVQIATLNYLIPALRFGHFNADNKTDVIMKDQGVIYVSYGCNTTWTPLASTGYSLDDIRIGDLTGDGIDDFFTTDAGKFWMKNNAIPGSSWTQIATSGVPVSTLKLGWFDLNAADSKIDVFYANGTSFQTAYDGVQSWLTLGNSGYTTSTLRLCDFDSDGISDVMNSTRQVSLKGRMSWANTTLNNFPLSTFTYGDFN